MKKKKIGYDIVCVDKWKMEKIYENFMSFVSLFFVFIAID